MERTKNAHGKSGKSLSLVISAVFRLLHKKAAAQSSAETRSDQGVRLFSLRLLSSELSSSDFRQKRP